VEGVSLRWLLGFVADLYQHLPDDLNCQVRAEAGLAEGLLIYPLPSEIDEMLSFVGKKQNKPWIWMAMDVLSRQIVAFHVRSRSRFSAQAQKEVDTIQLQETCDLLYRRMASL